MATWRSMISKEMASEGETFADVISIAPPDLDLDREFDAGFGTSEGKPFTIWTASRVYFPTEYDGAEGVRSVPRNPNGEVTPHV